MLVHKELCTTYDCNVTIVAFRKIGESHIQGVCARSILTLVIIYDGEPLYSLTSLPKIWNTVDHTNLPQVAYSLPINSQIGWPLHLNFPKHLDSESMMIKVSFFTNKYSLHESPPPHFFLKTSLYPPHNLKFVPVIDASLAKSLRVGSSYRKTSARFGRAKSHWSGLTERWGLYRTQQPLC